MMSNTTTATTSPTGGSDPGVGGLLDIKQTAELINTSTRTVYRLVESGGMPRPVKLGSLVRWRQAELKAWIAAGCPEVPPAQADRGKHA